MQGGTPDPFPQQVVGASSTDSWGFSKDQPSTSVSLQPGVDFRPQPGDHRLQAGGFRGDGGDFTAHVQVGANQVFMNPKLQDTMQEVVTKSAYEAARQSSPKLRPPSVQNIRHFAEENHCSVRILVFGIAIALVVSSVLGLFNLFEAAFSPFQYLLALYNAGFGILIIIIDGKPEWYDRCFNVQARLFEQAAFLATQLGRALVYFYVGSINLVTLPDNYVWKVTYIIMGFSLIVAGLLTLCKRCCGSNERAYSEGP